MTPKLQTSRYPHAHSIPHSNERIKQKGQPRTAALVLRIEELQA